MAHFEEMLAHYDHETERLLSIQCRAPEKDISGAFILFGAHCDTRSSGFCLAHMVISYLIPQSRFYHDPQVKAAAEAVFAYLFSHQRPGGCLDLSGCNFASAPDTAFTINEVISAWYLMEKYGSADTEWLKNPLRRLIESCCEGVMNGGFHTPNHRWAIAACLKHGAKICGRTDFSQKADVYLGEGLDINEDGEFAERSAGNYNQVNDDQMLRLFLATGDQTYLQAAKSNLLMMLSYIDPDGSVFTNNSTRQDYGKKVYLDSYYLLFLLTGYLLGDEDLAAYSEYCYQTAARHGCVPRGLPWLALYPDLEAFGKKKAPCLSAIENVNRLFAGSNIARYRKADFSCTVMAGRPNFLYFQHGENTLYLVMYGNVCEKRNFCPTSIEKTDAGFRVGAVMDSWYYLPFQGNGPATSDWWQMDNGNTREKLISDKLTVTADVAFTEDGAEVRLKTEGLSGVPVRLEFGVLPGNEVRSESFLLEAAAGSSMTVRQGTVQLTKGMNDTLTIGPAFARHNVQNRMGGAYPLSAEHFTLFFTDYSPFERVIRIGTKPVFDLTL